MACKFFKIRKIMKTIRHFEKTNFKKFKKKKIHFTFEGGTFAIALS